MHIATEGPIGLAMRNLLVHKGMTFTTSFHTRFPEYIKKRTIKNFNSQEKENTNFLTLIKFMVTDFYK